MAGFDLISYRLHAKPGQATYVKSSLTDASAELSKDHCDVIKVGSYSIANVYKPPSESWDTSIPLPALSHPAIYVGDFNSHHPDWGYDSEDAEGPRLMEWASLGDFSLIHDLKQRRTFRSTRWQRDFSPDLCWVSTTNCSRLPASCTVLEDFPRSQHRPTLVHIGLTIPVVHCTGKRRCNFRKADWQKFQACTESSIPSSLVAVCQLRKHTGGTSGLCPRQPTPPFHEESVLYTRHAWARNPEHCWRNTRSRETQT